MSKGCSLSLVPPGPDFWGRVNPEWNLCSKGKKQSPINIDPKHILFDPNLKHMHINKQRVSNYDNNNNDGNDIDEYINIIIRR